MKAAELPSEKSIRLVTTYFVKGVSPKNWIVKPAIRNPSVSGNAVALIIDGKKTSVIFSPITLEAWTVDNECLEIVRAKEIELDKEKVADTITRMWEKCQLLHTTQGKSFPVAASILKEWGYKVPTDIQRDDGEERKSHGGKETDMDRLKPVNEKTRRGQVAALFKDGQTVSIHEACSAVDMNRSGLLSHLHGIHKYHGIGYELVGDCARLTIPDGFDIFQGFDDENIAKEEDDEWLLT